MSLLFAWVYISDYFEVIPFVAMTVQVLVRFIFFPRRRRSLCPKLSSNNREHWECIYGQRWVHLRCLNQRKLKKDRTHGISKDWNPWTDRLCPRSERRYICCVFWATWCSRSRANLPTWIHISNDITIRLIMLILWVLQRSLFRPYVVFDREARECSINSFSLVLDHRRWLFCPETFIAWIFLAPDPTGRVAKAHNVSSTPKAYVILDNEVQWSGIADTSSWNSP